MNFLKAQLVPLICGVVVVLALAAYFVWPLPGYSSQLQDREKARLDTANPIKAAANMPIVIPGVKPFNGAITTKVIQAKEDVQKEMQNSAARISAMASQDNEAGRVVRREDKTVVPLLDGIPEPNYLPVVANNADPTDFTEAYIGTFDHWISLLVTGTKAAPATFDPAHAGAPPEKAGDLQQAWDIAEHKRVADLPTFAGVPPPLPNPNPDPSFVRNFVFQKAAKTRMYVTRECFQIRHPTSLNSEIFAALTDCWLQGDAVRTINVINSEALDNVPDDDKNVGHSPIKRLIHLSVGANAGAGAENTTGGGLLMETGKGVLDFSRSMTGRIGTDTYDVTAMDIVMDIDPSYINKFIAALYKQNNGYTVIGVKITAVDPFVAASNGYIYGNTQVVTADIRVEALLFRGWTQSIMPDAIRAGGGGFAPGGGGSVPGGMSSPGGMPGGFPHP